MAKDILKILHSYRCQYTKDIDNDEGSCLVDVLTPQGDENISNGKKEMELLADFIESELSS